MTAKLSKKTYETFGDRGLPRRGRPEEVLQGEEVANELVNQFTEVDATYRADLRELNDLNFARFDAKLEQRLAQLDAQWRVRWTELDGKITALGDTLRKELAETVGRLKSDLLKWMFGFWASVVVALAVLALRS